ncbi:MAG TPA: hypothetical protein PKC83_17170 [Gemmatimonadaceae bacterium]|nr:hypothetical protein [Gemmatimonadaceae bacterium]
MTTDDIFFGPLLRRCEPELVVIQLATYSRPDIRFSVKLAGTGAWLAHDEHPFTVQVTERLFITFGRIRPPQPFPTGALLAYGIGVRTATGWDDAPFADLVRQEKLAYDGQALPTFFLQRPRAPLTAFYGSCRKIHDAHGGKTDTMADGDALVARHVTDLARRPAVMCLGGDQVYADDVHDLVMRQVIALSRKIQPKVEELPGPGRHVGVGKRATILKRYAGLTSDDLDNHMIRLAEYLALYGLMWNVRTWSDPPKELEHFTKGLPAARRLMANCPTYMVFDDHDVTDDWNLSVRWKREVWAKELGRRVVANALMAYWLCQGYGNDPDAFGDAGDLAALVEGRERRYPQCEEAFWRIDRWEFCVPTDPFIYFLDTRTMRGHQDHDADHDPTGPAWLKTKPSWDATMRRLQSLTRNWPTTRPIVLVSAAPVFGFSSIEWLQRFISFFMGDYKYDYENWAANEEHLHQFLRLMAGRNVVLLSGDLHYGYSSTVRYTVFDSRTHRAGPRRTSPTGVLHPAPAGLRPTYDPVSTVQFLQLTSSAIKNYASKFLKFVSRFSGSPVGTIVDDDGRSAYGRFENGVFVVLEQDENGSGFSLVQRTRQEVRPATYFRQRIADAYNSGYLEGHNLGMVRIRDSSVEHSFLTPGGVASQRSWDFSNARYWQ